MQSGGLPTFNVWDYVQIIFRRKWFFILPFMTVFSTTTIGSFFLPKIYQSTAVILVEQKQLLAPLVQGMAVTPQSIVNLDTLQQQMLSWAKMEEMIGHLGLDKNIRRRTDLERLIKSLRKRIVIKMKGELIFVSFEDKDPKVAQEVVNYVTRTFVQESLLTQEEEANSAINFIKKQLGIYQQKLEEAEAALKEFKEENLFELPGDTSNLGRAIEFRNRLLELRLDIQEAYKMRDKILRQLASEPKFVVSETKEVSETVLNLQAKLANLHTKLQELYARKCTDAHPWVISLKKNIEHVEKQIEKAKKETVSTETTVINPVYQELEQRLQEVEMAIDSMEARERELVRLADEAEQKARSVPEQEQELAKLTRDMAVNERIYGMLLEKLEAANISHRLELAERGTRFRVIDPARYPLYPVKPNKKLIALMGFIVGIILGCGSVFIGEYTDHSFRSVEDLEGFLGQPVLGSTSKITTIEDIKQQKIRRRRQVFLVVLCFLFIGLLTFIVVFMVKG